MDVADASASESCMIALLPLTTDWCKIDLPHMTLVYGGLIADRKPTDFNEMAKDAAMLAMLTRPIQLRVTGVDVFGDNESGKVNVLKLQPTSELWAMRRSVESWNESEHSFSPHATIGPAEDFVDRAFLPPALYFDRIMVGWGDEQLTFWLKR